MLTDKFYRLEYKSDEKAIIKLSDENHPIFKAHFPDNPIMPGFMNFEIIAEIFDIEITTIKNAKFLKTALPNQRLSYHKNANKFKVFRDDEEISSFIL